MTLEQKSQKLDEHANTWFLTESIEGKEEQWSTLLAFECRTGKEIKRVWQKLTREAAQFNLYW